MSPPHTVLVAEDNDSVRIMMEQTLTRAGHEVLATTNVLEGRGIVETRPLDLAFLDLELIGGNGRELLALLHDVSPEVPAIVITSNDTAASAVELLRLGAWDYVVKPLEQEDVVHMADRAIQVCMSRRKMGGLSDAQKRGAPAWHVGQNPRMKAIATVVDKFAPTGAGLLIQGESGTGKEVVAKVIHHRSERCDGAFMDVNCAALPEQLLESELFGHEKGAFTGATTQHRGLLEAAHGGTLFLDELAMMSPALQAKLLRALQEFRFRRVGGTKEISVDVRVLAASNRNVIEAIGAGEFREDLYFRLCVNTIDLPALRQRAEDIPHFAELFLNQYRAQMGNDVEGISDAAMWALCNYRWPGNIRELSNAIERAVIMATGEKQIDVTHLPEAVRAAERDGSGSGRNGNGAGHPPSVLPSDGIDLKGIEFEWERSMVEQALQRTDGNQSAAARLLGLTRDELRYRVEKFRAVS